MSELIETQIETGLQVLDQKEASLIELREKFTGLQIKGADDKEGYKAVREARLTLKNARVQVEKDGKALRENAVKFQKTVIKREDELIKLIAPIERSLEAQEERYDLWQEEIRLAKQREENARIQARVDLLAKFGHAYDLYELKIMAEEKFLELITQVEIDYNQEQEKIALERAEAERLKREDEERNKLEREQLAKQKAEQDARECELQRLEQERVLAAKAEADKLKTEREKFEAEKRAHELEKAKTEAAEKARREEQERIEREAKAKAERERLAKIELERQEALSPDKDKLLKLSQDLAAFTFPEVTSDEAKEVIVMVSEKIIAACTLLNNKSKAL